MNLPWPAAGPPVPRSPRWVTTMAWAAVVATPLAWSTVAFVFIGMNAAGRELSFSRAVLAGLPDWYLWAIFTPIVFWLGQRFQLERDRWMTSAGVHLAGGIIFALADLALVALFNRALQVPTFAGAFGDVFLRLVLQYFHFHFLIYWVIVAAAHALRYYGASRQRELESAQLRTELTQAQLSALQLQLQPHFFFNTLHTIATLVREGRREAATDTIALLGDLFRRTLGSASRNEVSLREEVDFLSAYLDIERVRFSDRLEIRLDLDPETLEAQVPSMALQPLVENAIRHGIARDPEARLVEISTQRVNGTLCLAIRNDGPPYQPARRGAGTGLGLRNIRARLGRMYGDAFRLDIVSEPAGKTTVALAIPWRVLDPS